MPISLRALISSNILHRTSACIIGFLLWSQLTSIHNQTTTVTAPLCFYGNTAHELEIQAPETVTITLRGKRRDLAGIDTTLLAIHIDTAQLREGKNGIVPAAGDLFLPETISVIHYNPLPIVVAKHTRKS